MTKHLPECPTDWCICPYLRACEKRVLRDTSFTVNGPEDVAKRLSENLSKVATGAYQRGRSDALDAARELVASMVIETVGNSAATVEQAVSVIDALMEKP